MRLPVAAAGGPPLLGVIFIPVFRAIQSVGYPTGSLEGIDLTPFARRDELVVRIFAAILLLFALLVAAHARTWHARAGTFLLGVVSGCATMFVVFFALMAS